MKKRAEHLSLIFLSVLVLLFARTGTVYSQGLSVSPGRLFFSGKPGETVSLPVTFTNHSAQELFFVSGIRDWDRDSLGVKHYYPMDSLADSNGKWITLSEASVHLNPHERKNVFVSLTVPATSAKRPELTHSMLFFTQTKEQKASDAKKGGFAIDIIMEIGIQVYHVPPGLAAGSLEFLAFEDKGFSKDGKDSIRAVAVKIRNTGAINKDAYVRTELTDLNTGREIPIKPVPVAMLPKAEQWVTLSLPTNLKGRFSVIAILDAGKQYDLKVAEKQITY